MGADATANPSYRGPEEFLVDRVGPAVADPD